MAHKSPATDFEMSRKPQPLAGKYWYLEGYVDAGRKNWRTVIRRLPLCLGRGAEMDLQLLADSVSNRHAEISSKDDSTLWIRDLGSTNGTFVNGRRIVEETRLAEGDVLHIADLMLRLAVYPVSEESHTTRSLILGETELAAHLAGLGRQFNAMLEQRQFETLFQPVMDLERGEISGYELLSRGRIEGLEVTPTELFYIAEKLAQEAELSGAFREKGLAEVERLPGEPTIFLNTHPVELQDPSVLIASLDRFRRRGLPCQIALEVHEAAMTDVGAMRRLRSALDELGMKLAFDDFGTGQARLVELSEVPPDYLKFDISLIRGLHEATAQRSEMLRSLVGLTRSMGATPVAEGVERLEEAEACAAHGFRYAQGFHFGRPEPAA